MEKIGCKIIAFALALVIPACGILPGYAVSNASAAVLRLSGAYPQPASKAALLMDTATGRVLYQKNSQEELPMASVTKMMTALLVCEAGQLDQVVTISKNAAETGEASIWLAEGERLTRSQLLYALMLNSANDAATALAESVGGTEQNFVQMMNQKAKELQLQHTHFCNPHGLNAAGHYSSAYDLAVIARAGLANPMFSKLVSTKSAVIPWAGHPYQRALYNHNRLLSLYQGAIGVKTGYTNEAGSCLVSAAKRGNLTLIAVVLHSDNEYGDSEQLLNYGFAHYQGVALAQTEARVSVSRGMSGSVTVQPDRQLLAAATSDELSRLSVKLSPAKNAAAPVKKGEVLGSWQIVLGSQVISSGKLLASSAIAYKPNTWERFLAWLKRVF
jgi:D-alanyl-D-alanine carboxypeptidase (penicillin-binding protein 5/6)